MVMVLNIYCSRDPNGGQPTASPSEATAGQKGNSAEDTTAQNAPFWDTYDTINQLYMELGKGMFYIGVLLRVSAGDSRGSFTNNILLNLIQN